MRDLDQLVTKYAEKMEALLENLLPRRPNEAVFRQHVNDLLNEFRKEAGMDPLNMEMEYASATGRADALFDRLVIEYKRPKSLSQDITHHFTAQTVEQVKRYIKDIAKRHKHELTRMAGIVFDGYYLIFIRYHAGNFIEEPVRVDQNSLEKMFRWLASLSGIALTPKNLYRDFSIEQLRTQKILRALFKGLTDSVKNQPNGVVARLFEQWRTFFSQSIDYAETFGGRKLEPLQKWVQKAGFEVKSTKEAECFFFVLHTYFALLVKLLAWLALSRHFTVKLGVPSFSKLAASEGEVLRCRLEDMESGGIFRAYGILNLLEGDFFAWYLYAWNDQIEAALREILKRLDEYDPTTLTIIPEETRDLFKKLYHYLLPREIRHNLGEYYTPDWLAQRLLNQVDNEFFLGDPRRNESRMRQRLLNTRFLDPACGSGTFLVLIIARMRELAQALFIQEEELLGSILKNVVGFDLNPLAVLTARVNYLLAIADLLEYRKGEVTIPVYLADSVRTPAMVKNLFTTRTITKGAYKFPTAVGEFLIPAQVAKPEFFHRFCNLVEDSLKANHDVETFLRRLERELAHPDWDKIAEDVARATYEKLLDLHRRRFNGLWARLLKNNFAPLTMGQFDYIVGNPPWVNWEHLPDEYRRSIAPLWTSYAIFPHKGFDAILGKSKDDISILMTYVVMDKLLKEDGRLGFVITQSVFKTAGGGQGFRRFQIQQGEGKNNSVACRPCGRYGGPEPL